MRLVAPDAEQAAALRRPTKVHPMDEPEGPVTLLAGDDGGDRQEQLIDPAAGDESAEQLGTTFGKDRAVAVGLQCLEDVVDADPLSIGNSAHLGGLRQRRAEALGRGRRRQYQRTGLERTIGWIQLAAGADDDEAWSGVAFQRLAQGTESVGRRRKNVLGGPQGAPAFGSDGTRANQDCVGEGTQQAHHETIGLVAAADDPTGWRRTTLECDEPIDRADEVRVDAPFADRQSTVIELGQLGWERAGLEIGPLEQPLNRLQE